MGKRAFAFSALAQVPSAGLNEIQDRGLSALSGNQNNNYAADKAKGIDLRVTGPGSIATATRLLIDDSIDWRDRQIFGECVNAGGTDYPGATTDYNSDYLNGTTRFHGYLGSGAVSNLTTGAAVSYGNPPLQGAGVFRSYAVRILDAGPYVYLYCDPTTGALYLYNNTAGSRRPLLVVSATGKLGVR